MTIKSLKIYDNLLSSSDFAAHLCKIHFINICILDCNFCDFFHHFPTIHSSAPALTVKFDHTCATLKYNTVAHVVHVFDSCAIYYQDIICGNQMFLFAVFVYTEILVQFYCTSCCCTKPVVNYITVFVLLYENNYL